MSGETDGLPLTRGDLEAAYARVRRLAHRTPVLTSRTFDERSGARLFFKCENQQRVGAFKFRGAVNTLGQLAEDELARGVVTHSSGNHGQAVALAARLHGATAYVVMPRNVTTVKEAAVGGYGARVTLCEPTFAAREAAAAEIIESTGAELVHPFDDLRIIAGQATAAMELLEDVPDLDTVLVPIGGGGLAGGSALAARFFSPETTVVAAEPSGADDAYRSLATGTLQPTPQADTLADGLRTGLSELTFGLARRLLERIVTVDDDEIVAAMRMLWERMKIVVEPSSAVPVAALLARRADLAGRRIGVILTGGNVDLDNLPW